MANFIIDLVLFIGKYISSVDTPKAKKADKSATNATGSLAHAVMSLLKYTGML